MSLNLDAQITIARDDLRCVVNAMDAAWRIDLDLLRTGNPSTVEVWEYEFGYSAGVNPELRRPTKVRRESPALWLHRPRSIHDRWVKATQEVARAHRRLLETDWPGDDPTVGLAWIPDRLLTAAAQARTVGRTEALQGALWLSLGLEWARTADLATPEENAVLGACEHAMTARTAIDVDKGARRCRVCERRTAEERRSTCRRCRADRLDQEAS